jgi:hypothetical protein
VKDPNLPLYRNALVVKEELFRLIKVEVGPRPIFAFVEATYGSFQADLEVVLRKTGFIVISDIPIQMTKAWKKGRGLFAVDNTHWNEEGNKIVGDLVAPAVNDGVPSQSEAGND